MNHLRVLKHSKHKTNKSQILNINDAKSQILNIKQTSDKA